MQPPKANPKRRSEARVAAALAGVLLASACAHPVRVITVPEGASVSIDGQPAEKAPFLYKEHSGIPGRSTQFKVELAGYAPITRKESVRLCGTTGNVLLDLFLVGFLFGWCLQDEYVFDLTRPAK
jgi:hypothetical protein